MPALAASRSDLDARVLAWMHEAARDPGAWRPDEARFDALAREIFAFQFAGCPPYARFCSARGVTPERVTSWRDVPAVPTGAFKETALRCFPAERTVKTFRTSGTTGGGRGELHLDTLALYEASLLPVIRRFVFPDLAPGERMAIRVLAPSPDEAPDSSLSHMFGCALAALGDAASGFDVVDGVLRTDALHDALEAACQRGAPLALCGTAFAFVHAIDAARGRALQLPPGSRVMETGGFKGRSRTLPRGALLDALERTWGVPAQRVVNQYGMTELGSQFYDSVLLEPDAPRRKLGPPWARVRAIDPETLREAAPGATGMLVIHDLANTGSVAAVQTADLGRRCGDGFEVLGRDPDAEERGCSVAADVLLGGARAR